MFKADDYRLKIQDMREVLKEAEYALDIEHLRPRLAELEKGNASATKPQTEDTVTQPAEGNEEET